MGICLTRLWPATWSPVAVRCKAVGLDNSAGYWDIELPVKPKLQLLHASMSEAMELRGVPA